ncbi:MAG: hypothetical protein RIQ49_82 [Pseudomonadota bacterium]|jgi:DNA-binding transcriptional MerR regulator
MTQDDDSAYLKTRGMVDQLLPPIPAKRYFTIGEVSDLCAVKPHVLRYWEQEFTQLRPMKRRGNRRYYQHHEVLLVRKIRELLYDEGFTIQGARMRLSGRQTISNLQAEAAAISRTQPLEHEEAKASESGSAMGGIDQPNKAETKLYEHEAETKLHEHEAETKRHEQQEDPSIAMFDRLRIELNEVLRLLSIDEAASGQS